MEVNERLAVNENEFFNMLEQSLIYEINQATGKNFKCGDIKKGFTYKKNMKNKLGQSSDVNVTICEFTPNKHYKASFDNNIGTTYIEYIITPYDDNNIDVKYSEEFKSQSSVKSLNQKIMEFVIFNKQAKKRAIKLLHSIENYIKYK